jgi:hypothetical protein
MNRVRVEIPWWGTRMWIYLLLFLAAVVVLMVLSGTFRGRIHEIWNIEVVSLLKLAWPYVLILAAYDVLTNGSIATAIKAFLNPTP